MHRKDSFKQLLREMLTKWRYLFFVLFCLIMVSTIDTTLPLGIQPLIDGALVQKNMALLNVVAVAVVGIFIFRGVFVFCRLYFTGVFELAIIEKLRNQLYEHISKLPIGFFDTNNTGLIMSRITNDMFAVQQFLNLGFINAVDIPFKIGLSVVLLLRTSWKLTLVSLVALPLIAYLITLMARKMRAITHLIQEKIADLTEVLQETISAIRVVKSFTMEDKEIKKFRSENRATVNAALKGYKIQGITAPAIEALAAVGLMGVIYVGGRLVLAESLTTGQLIAFLFILTRLFHEAKRIGELMLSLSLSLASMDRIYDILDLKTEFDGDDARQQIPEIQGNIVFENVTLSYKADEEVLKEINFTVSPGEIVALVGPSGAGKTSIVNLMPCFYKPDSGRILIDGLDISDVKIKSLRRQIGIVHQNPLIFNCPIRDNIAYGRLDSTQEEIVEAARAANIESFINALPQGYDTMCGERGVSFSGGERQRISIARAILRNPRILILDEATSSLDTSSERLVQEALERLMKGRTTFVIAHRLSTILKADHILVLDDGRIVEMGTHSELCRLGGLYKRLYDLQFANRNDSHPNNHAAAGNM